MEPDREKPQYLYPYSVYVSKTRSIILITIESRDLAMSEDPIHVVDMKMWNLAC